MEKSLCCLILNPPKRTRLAITACVYARSAPQAEPRRPQANGLWHFESGEYHRTTAWSEKTLQPAARAEFNYVDVIVVVFSFKFIVEFALGDALSATQQLRHFRDPLDPVMPWMVPLPLNPRFPDPRSSALAKPPVMVLEILNPWRSPKDEFEPAPLPALLFRAPVKVLLHQLHHLLSRLRSTPGPSQPPIRVVCISDTHTHIPDHVPDGDILIHAGDMTNAGSVEEIQAQINWLSSLPHQEIIVISGNHDTYLDPRTRPSLSAAQREGTLDWGRVHYLQHKLLTLTLRPRDTASTDARTPLLRDGAQRRLRIYGAPQIPACGPMSVHAFQYARGSDAWSETVPEDLDILVTHTPPKYHLDLALPTGLGCEHLLNELTRVKPVLHVFGHVHWGAGRGVVHWDRAHEAYVQGMGTESRYTRGVLNLGLWWNVVRVVYRGVRELLWDRVWGGQSAHTVLVNAAQMKGNTGELGNPIQVVEI